jgi:hypothetical protein
VNFEELDLAAVASQRGRPLAVSIFTDAMPFGPLWYGEPDDAIEYAKLRSYSHDAVIRVYDEAGDVIETHQHTGDFKEW